MGNVEDILISIEDRHVKNMLTGIKTVELRRRPLRIDKGTRVWIYSKMPQGQIKALGIVDKIIQENPFHIWETYGEFTGITKQEYNEYFDDLDTATAIFFRCITQLEPALSLNELRQRISAFHPPQFFKRLTERSDERSFFHTVFAQSL